MDETALLTRLAEAVPGVGVELARSVDRHTTMYVPADHVSMVAHALRDLPDLGFNLLADLAAVDYWPREPRYELVYILVSTEHRRRLRMKVRVSGERPHAATLCAVWPAANWLEREVWDLFGIAFDDHPDPRRLLMPDDWEGHPLRKDYPVQIVLKPRTFEPMQVTEEEFRANLSRDRLSRP